MFIAQLHGDDLTGFPSDRTPISPNIYHEFIATWNPHFKDRQRRSERHVPLVVHVL